MRYPMRLNKAVRPLLALFGGVPAKSWVEVIDGAVRFKFGTFDESVALADVAGVEPTTVPWIAGLGWRIGPGGRVGLLGSHQGVADVTLRAPRRVKVVGIPFRCRHLLVSLEDRDAFVADLRARL
jgi:hypothetical protein